MHRRVVSTILIVVILILIQFIGIGTGEAESGIGSTNCEESTIWLSSHEGISLSGDIELMNQAFLEGWPGNGTEGNPYLLDGYSFIESTGTIYIRDTTLHFNIINCTFNTTRTGIGLHGSSNITLENNTFLGFSDPSISIMECYNITILHCDLSNGPENGIEIYHCSHILIKESVIESSSYRGFLIYNVDNVTIQNVNLRNNYQAIDMLVCENVLIESSNFTDSKNYGIETSHINNLVIRNCDIEGFSRYGMSVHGTNILIQDNTIRGYISGLKIGYFNGLVMYNNQFLGCGIHVNNAHGDFYNSTIPPNNTVNNVPILMIKDRDFNDGEVDQEYSQMILVNVSDLVIKDKTIVEVGTLLTLISCSRIVINGLITSDLETGVYAINSDNLTITNSYIRNFRRYGVVVQNGQDIKVDENTIWNSHNSGIRFSLSTRGLASGNIIENVSTGISLSGNKELIVKENIVRDCDRYGTVIQNSDLTEISKNSYDNCWIGTYVSGNGNVSIIGNIIMNSSSGVSLSNDIDPDSTDRMRVIIENNQISSRLGDGILIRGFADTFLYSNKMEFSGIRINSIDSKTEIAENNTLNGKSIHYEKDVNGELLSTFDDPGQIILVNCSETSIEDEVLSNVSSGVQLISCSDIRIENISIENSIKGVHLYESADINISHCLMNDVENGIYSCYVDRLDLEDLKISGGSFGIDILRSNNINISDSRFEAQSDIGILLRVVSDSDIQDNFFINCTVGAQMRDRVYNSVIHDNVFYKCAGPGLKMGGDSDSDTTRGNMIYRNLFLFNNGSTETNDPLKMQAMDNTEENYWNSTDQVGNYWSDWTGPDIDGDGIVDVPKEILFGGGSDFHPLVEMPLVLTSQPEYFGGEGGNGWVNLTWEEPFEDVLGDGHTYEIYRSTPGTDFVLMREAGEDERWFNDSIVINGLEYLYYMISINVVGRSEPTHVLSFTPDGDPPYIVSLYPEEGAMINSTNITVRWSVKDFHSGVNTIEVRINQGQWIDVTEAELYSFSDLTDGPHTIELRAFDHTGNSILLSHNITIDTTPPEIEIFWPSGSRYFRFKDVEIGWNCTDLLSGVNGAWVRIDEHRWVEFGPDLQNTFFDLTHGEHRVVVRSVDGAGNFFEVEEFFEVDLVPPTLRIIHPVQGYITNTNDIDIIWDFEDDGTGVVEIVCEIDGEFAFNASWTDTAHTVSLSEGGHIIEITALDRARNHFTSHVEIRIDTTLSTITSNLPVGNMVDIASSAWVTFSEAMDHENTTIGIQGVSGNISWEGDTIYFVPSEPLQSGKEFNVIVTGEDLAGNLMEYSWQFQTEGVENEIDDDGNDKTDHTVAIIVSLIGMFLFILIAVYVVMKRRKKPEDQIEGSEE